MKKIIFIILNVLIFIQFLGFNAIASGGVDTFGDDPSYIRGEDLDENTLSELDDLNKAQLLEALPEEVREQALENDILELSFEGVISELWGVVKKEITLPLKMLVSLMGVIFLCAIVETLRDTGTGGSASSVTKAFEMVGVLALAGIMSINISECVMRAGQTITSAGAFVLILVPILAGIMVIMGQSISSNLLSTGIIMAAQIFSGVIVTFLMPLSASILGISIASAVNPELKTERFAETVKKIVIWILGILAVVFTGILGTQSLVTANIDSAAMKAVKFTISGGVPIIGGAVSDALGAIKGSVSILKGGTGAFGMVAIVLICTPPLVSVMLFRGVLMLSSAVSEIFGTSRIGSLLKSGENVLSIIFALIVCFLLIMLVSIAIMMKIGTGG